jgi:hypothetical protein
MHVRDWHEDSLLPLLTGYCYSATVDGTAHRTYCCWQRVAMCTGRDHSIWVASPCRSPPPTPAHATSCSLTMEPKSRGHLPIHYSEKLMLIWYIPQQRTQNKIPHCGRFAWWNTEISAGAAETKGKSPAFPQSSQSRISCERVTQDCPSRCRRLPEILKNSLF